MESAKLVNGFDLSTLLLMLERPDISTRGLVPAAIMASVIFLTYLVFIDGGVFTVLLDDRKLSRAEFFENAGLFFWRMVRLTLSSLVPFGLLAAAYSGMTNYADKLADNASPDRLGFFVNVASALVIAVAALFVRMWFDLTQARVVRDNERRLAAALLRSLKLAFHSGRLFASYIGIGLFAAATFSIGAGTWVFLPHRAMGASFVLLELVTIAQIASRIWLKAASARWVALLPGEAILPMVPVIPALVEETPAPVPVDVPPTPETAN
jgi:hypothetical protein